MANNEQRDSKRRGRPTIDDHLAVYLHVEIGRRATCQNVRAFCSRRGTAFRQIPKWFIGPMAQPVREIAGETLRRRYGEARRGLGLSPRYGGVTLADDHPLLSDTQKTLDQMVESYMA